MRRLRNWEKAVPRWLRAWQFPCRSPIERQTTNACSQMASALRKVCESRTSRKTEQRRLASQKQTK